MQPGRSPPPKEVFLGTAEIIRRVRDAQASPWARWMGTARFYALVALSGAVACGLGAIAWRERHAGPTHAAAPEPSVAAGAAPARAPTTQKGAAAHVLQPAESRHAPKQWVTVRLAHHRAAAVWLDGVRVVEHKRHWEGQLAPGQHELAIRVGGHMLRHTFEVAGHPLQITADPTSHAFTVVGHQGGHRSARGH